MTGEASHSTLWAIGGIWIWILALMVPLMVYFVIAAFQRSRPRKGPGLELGERIDRDVSRPVQREDENHRNVS